MYTNDIPEPEPEPGPARRRIIQQPLRTEAPMALIVGDSRSLSELAERLKRAHPLISFPSFAHFLAEPPRREAWSAIVVARAGAWDPRLDRYVRRRSNIALFGLPEESYGWPEAVARVRDLTELEPWLSALHAPEPPPVLKERPKRASRVEAHGSARERRAEAKAALSALGVNWMRKTTRVTEAPPAPTAAEQAAPQAEAKVLPAVAAASPVQLELAALAAPAVLSSLARGTAHFDRSHVEQRASTAPGGPRKTRALPAPKPETRVLSRPARVALPDDAQLDSGADREFTRVAAELGLVRACELLQELRERARRLAETMSRDT